VAPPGSAPDVQRQRSSTVQSALPPLGEEPPLGGGGGGGARRAGTRLDFGDARAAITAK
jgi:hypothetical protein